MADVSCERTIAGLALLKGALAHFDIFVAASTNANFVQALVHRFSLPSLAGEDCVSLCNLWMQAESQKVTTEKEFKGLVTAEERAGQEGALKVCYKLSDR